MILQENDRICRADGWAADVHRVDGDTVYVQEWPPGVENQLWIDNLFQYPAPDLLEQIGREGLAVMRRIEGEWCVINAESVTFTPTEPIEAA